MTALALTVYILMWPVIGAVVLGAIWVACYREFREAKRTRTDMV